MPRRSGKARHFSPSLPTTVFFGVRQFSPFPQHLGKPFELRLVVHRPHVGSGPRIDSNSISPPPPPIPAHGNEAFPQFPPSNHFPTHRPAGRTTSLNGFGGPVFQTRPPFAVGIIQRPATFHRRSDLLLFRSRYFSGKNSAPTRPPNCGCSLPLQLLIARFIRARASNRRVAGLREMPNNPPGFSRSAVFFAIGIAGPARCWCALCWQLLFIFPNQQYEMTNGKNGGNARGRSRARNVVPFYTI